MNILDTYLAVGTWLGGWCIRNNCLPYAISMSDKFSFTTLCFEDYKQAWHVVVVVYDDGRIKLTATTDWDDEFGGWLSEFHYDFCLKDIK